MTMGFALARSKSHLWQNWALWKAVAPRWREKKLKGLKMGILDQANKDFDYEIVDDFIDHFEVMKDAMQPAILGLENAELYAEYVNELFRIFHNLKSASTYLHFKGILRLSEFVENALEIARNSEGPASAEYVDWLLKVSDQFALWFLDLVNDRERFSPIAHSEVFDTPHLLDRE